MVNPAAGDRVYVPSEVARAGSTADLCEQFMLSKGSDAPEGFQADVLASWTLAHHPTSP